MGDDEQESYKFRAEWMDIVPIFHSEDEDSVVRIKYSEKFREVFAYFRAILQNDERSERALKLTTDAALLNPANYTVWQYRRNILKSLQKDLKEEFEFTSEIILDSPKNYQVWHHRRVLIEWSSDCSRELDFTEEILQDDSKNYHAWQHRQWVAQTYKLWGNELDNEAELSFSSRLISEDLRNNSAWNYRHFVISNTTGFTESVLEREIKITLDIISKAPHNESSWNYLNGILMDKGLTGDAAVEKFCHELYEGSKHRSPHLLAFMVDGLAEKIENSNESTETLIKQACKETFCSTLWQLTDCTVYTVFFVEMVMSGTINKTYTAYYSQDHMCILVHPNGVGVLTLAPGHPLLGKKVTKIDFELGKRNYAENKVSGKRKRGGFQLQPDTKLCKVTCEDEQEYILRTGVKAKLIEINERLLQDEQLLTEKPEGRGHIAVLFPVNIEKANLMSFEEYTARMKDSS